MAENKCLATIIIQVKWSYGPLLLTYIANGPWKKKFELYFPY